MNSVEIHYKNSLASIKLGHYLSEFIHRNTAIVCIGTDKCIVDSLGPLIGTMLKKGNIDVDVYGTLDKPVHAINLKDYIKTVKSRKYSQVLAIDACLSVKKGQGIVEIKKGPITPGKGIGKYLPEIGDYSIIGIVESSEKAFQDLVQETRLSFIYEMAEVISDGIFTALDMVEIRYQDDYLKENVSLSSR